MSGAALFLSAASACNRTPPEPTPASSSEAKSAQLPESGARVSTAPPVPSARCITSSPSAAPAIPPPASRCPADPDTNPKKLPIVDVTFSEAPNAPRIEAELVRASEDVEKGLMYRRSMGSDKGMLFRLDSRRDHTFWMRNTCIALDMLFVDEDGTIVGIVEGAAPLTETTRSVGCPSLFVLEVNGGWTRAHGVRPGQKMSLPFAAR